MMSHCRVVLAVLLLPGVFGVVCVARSGAQTQNPQTQNPQTQGDDQFDPAHPYATHPAPQTPAVDRYPAGTKIMVRVNQNITSQSAILGQPWDGTLVNAIPVGNRVVAQPGAPCDGIITEVKRPGALHGKGSVSLLLAHANGVAVSTDTITRDGNGHLKSNTQKIGGGAAAGAGLGGLFGGGTGALIGAGAGAAAGTVGAAATNKHQSELPSESVITFTEQ